MITDNIILDHELVKAYSRKRISPRCTIKIDLQKEYDSVECPYLRHVRKELGQLFTAWVIECIQTVNYSILIN